MYLISFFNFCPCHRQAPLHLHVPHTPRVPSPPCIPPTAVHPLHFCPRPPPPAEHPSLAESPAARTGCRLAAVRDAVFPRAEGRAELPWRRGGAGRCSRRRAAGAGPGLVPAGGGGSGAALHGAAGGEPPAARPHAASPAPGAAAAMPGHGPLPPPPPRKVGGCGGARGGAGAAVGATGGKRAEGLGGSPRRLRTARLPWRRSGRGGSVPLQKNRTLFFFPLAPKLSFLPPVMRLAAETETGGREPTPPPCLPLRAPQLTPAAFPPGQGALLLPPRRPHRGRVSRVGCRSGFRPPEGGRRAEGTRGGRRPLC